MQLILLALALGVFAHDALDVPGSRISPLPAGWLWASVLVPKALLVLAYAAACAWVYRRLAKPGYPARLRWLDRGTSAYAYAALGLFAWDLYAGTLVAVRDTFGDTVLLDELAVMAPVVLMLAVAWWAYYPIDHRLRSAALIAQVDSGLPVYPIWTRAQYVLAQLRHQVALILAPLLVIMAWAEAIAQYGPRDWGWYIGDPRPLLTGLGAVGTFLFAPVMLRHLWDTTPLPDGEIRQSMLDMCRRHRVRVREVLLWRTYGGIINAAVMGIVAPLRYILLSDALLDLLRRDEVEAVMAHELAHVRRRHMFWLIAAAVVIMALLEVSAYLILEQIPFVPTDDGPVFVIVGQDWSVLASPRTTSISLMLGAAAAWIAAFGWVSRRMERQADSFAVAHLATQQPEPARDKAGSVLVDANAARIMISALAEVARLNHISPHRRSWRHGSIAWRQEYLRSLVDRPVDGLPIDRQMRYIKLVILVGGVLASVGYGLIPLPDASLLLAM